MLKVRVCRFQRLKHLSISMAERISGAIAALAGLFWASTESVSSTISIRRSKVEPFDLADQRGSAGGLVLARRGDGLGQRGDGRIQPAQIRLKRRIVKILVKTVKSQFVFMVFLRSAFGRRRPFFFCASIIVSLAPKDKEKTTKAG